jgi:hypothetical protein
MAIVVFVTTDPLHMGAKSVPHDLRQWSFNDDLTIAIATKYM